MKKDFSQPIDHTRLTVICFLIEVGRDMFVHFDHPDEALLDYYNGLHLEVDESIDYTSQLAKYLYENGFALNHYRELARETKVAFAFIDDTLGYSSDNVCFHIYADRIDEPQGKREVTILTLLETLDRFEGSPDLPRVAALGLAQLFNERDTINIH
jgi:hypothetical protein